VAIDRPLTLRNAEKLLRQGKLDAAIAEYLRVVEDQPQDWNTANVLGDLYMRAGQSDKAVEQFARIADSLSREGFWPKAAALYKKIIKIRPDDEHALLQAGEMAAVQGVLVDARTYLNKVAERRLARGDRQGAAKIRVRLGSLDPLDFEARCTAARARVEVGDLPGAIGDFKVIASDLADKGRQTDSMAALREAADLDPNDQAVLEQLFTLCLAAGDLEAAEVHATTPAHVQKLGQAYVERGDIASASRFLNDETAAHDPVLLLKIAEAKLLTGARDDGLSMVRRLLNQEPARSHEIALFGCEIARSALDAGFAVVEIAAETSVIEGDWPSAAAALLEFVARTPDHIPALLRLVEICVDGGLDSTLNAAQSQLANAYLAAGVATEARVIAEDLIARSPSEPAHIDQLRRALVMLGEDDPDRIIAERVSTAAHDDASPDLLTASPPDFEVAAVEDDPIEVAATEDDRIEVAAIEDDRIEIAAIEDDQEVWLIPDATVAESVQRPPDPIREDVAFDDAIEVDLSDLLGDFTMAASPPAGSRPVPAKPVEARDLEEVFEQFRQEASRGAGQDRARSEYDRGVALRDEGRIEESMLAFKTASREPRLRFHAAAAVARLQSQRGDVLEAVDWFEQAAQAPAPSADEGYGLLYELAEALESLGEVERALAICLELQSEAGDYRDVAVQISRLAKVQTRG
jgi:tetratricopeptide (TPR) repeat protein